MVGRHVGQSVALTGESPTPKGTTRPDGSSIRVGLAYGVKLAESECFLPVSHASRLRAWPVARSVGATAPGSNIMRLIHDASGTCTRKNHAPALCHHSHRPATRATVP